MWCRLDKKNSVTIRDNKMTIRDNNRHNNRRNVVVFALLTFIVLCLFLLYSPFKQGPSQESQKRTLLSGYSQDAESFTIEFNSIEGNIFYVALSKVPETLDLETLRKDSRPANTNSNRVVIPLENEPFSGEYSIILFAQDGYVEVIRQSSAWLKNTFDFDRLGGYSILGRRSLDTNFLGTNELGSLAFINKPNPFNVDPVKVSKFKEINSAAGLLSMMWSQSIQQGPTSKSYSDFLGQTFEAKIREVRSGEFALMCQGFRDLFLHASTAIPKLKMRAVEAYNYSPQIPDLITYSHSTAEVWVEQLKGWVLFDPWLGIIVTQDGVPIGAQELGKLENIEGVSIIPVIDSMPRMYQEKDGKIVYNSFSPSTVKLSQFSCANLGCSPGYVEYFKNIKVREHHLITRQVD